MDSSNTTRWDSIDRIRGFRVLASDQELLAAQQKVVLARNPNNYLFRDRGSEPAEYDQTEYGRLNEALHEAIQTKAREHFEGATVPDDYPAIDDVNAEFLAEIGTPFTYQNWDWYQPTYECYVSVLAPYVSSSLLITLQALLVDELADWCVVVAGCDDTGFDDEDRLVFVFSDHVLLDQDAATGLGIPG